MQTPARLSQPQPTPKPWIEAIHAYVPGQSTGADGRPLIKLSANENPLGCSPLALEAMQRAATDPAARYPDPDSRALREALAATHGLEVDRLVCGTGSDELLNLAAQAYAGPGDEVLYVRYGFAVYDIAARRCGATPVVAPDRAFATDVDALLGAVTPHTRVVFLANPNNPTGTLASRADVARLHAALPGDVLLVLDQAYAEYLEPDEDDHGLALARDAGNVLVTRTFSKIYGLARERIGWAYGAPTLVAALNRIRGPFNVTGTGQAAAVAALQDQAFVAQARAHNRHWRGWLAQEIAALGNAGLRVVPSHANFLLVLFEGPLTGPDAQRGLAKAGYAVRSVAGQGLPQALRITIGQEEDVRGVAETLRRLAEQVA